MKKGIFLLSVFLFLPIFSSSFAETQKKYEFRGYNEDATVQLFTTIKDTDKIIEVRILNLGHKYIVFDKKQFDRLEILRVWDVEGKHKSVCALQPAEDEVFIINPEPAYSPDIKFSISGLVGYYHLNPGDIKEMKLILNRGSLEIILKPEKPEKKK